MHFSQVPLDHYLQLMVLSVIKHTLKKVSSRTSIIKAEVQGKAFHNTSIRLRHTPKQHVLQWQLKAAEGFIEYLYY